MLPTLPSGLELPAFKTAAQLLLSEIIQKAPPTKDVYHTLSSKQKAAWTYGESRSINDTIAAMTSMPVNLVVDVRLVGMDGDGSTKLHIVASQLERYLMALHGEMDTVALQPELRRLLPLQPKVQFRVSHAPENIREGIHSAIERAFKHSREHPDDSVYTPFVMVPYKQVDDFINSDRQVYRAALQRDKQVTSTFTLYLLTPAHFDEHYGYSYDDPDKAVKRNIGDPNGVHLGMDGSCPGTLWAGKRPYAWVDLAAGPIVYGPGLGHQGQVLAHSLPRPDTYVSIPMANTAILPDLAALTWSACKHLVWPPLHHAELDFREAVVVQIIHMHDTLLPPDRHVDAHLLFDQLHSAVPQITAVQEKFVSFADCDVCVAAFTAATKLRTSNDGSGQVQAVTRPFLDRLVLHRMMQRFKDKIFGYADVRFAEADVKIHVLPVFVFDLSQDVVLLLDDESRSVAFPDMVLAVATKGGEPLRTHFSCLYQRVLMDGKDITREVMASVLQSGWGVAHTASYHSQATGENANYLWSVGNTPFGPFSLLPSLSATQTHVAQRNHIIVLLDNAARRIRDVMQGFGKLCPKGHVECVLDSVLKTKLVRRLNMFEWKAWQAAEHIAAWDAHAALPYARSAMHDATAIELLAVHGSSGRVEARIKCEGHVETWHFFVYPALAMLSWLAALALRLRVSRPKLHKQY